MILVLSLREGEKDSKKARGLLIWIKRGLIFNRGSLFVRVDVLECYLAIDEQKMSVILCW